MPVKVEINDYLTEKWAFNMLDAPVQVPMLCLKGVCCTCCFAYEQRTELLDITGEPYVCCGGTCPCGPLGKPCPADQAKAWLGVEAVCCTFQAVTANRYMVQTRFGRMNDPCDDMLLAYTAMINTAAILAECFCDREDADNLRLMADIVNCSVCACMLAQQQNEIGIIQEQLAAKGGYKGPGREVMGLLPPEQQKMVTTSKQEPPGQYGAMT